MQAAIPPPESMRSPPSTACCWAPARSTEPQAAHAWVLQALVCGDSGFQPPRPRPQQSRACSRQLDVVLAWIRSRIAWMPIIRKRRCVQCFFCRVSVTNRCAKTPSRAKIAARLAAATPQLTFAKRLCTNQLCGGPCGAPAAGQSKLATVIVRMKSVVAATCRGECRNDVTAPPIFETRPRL